jgi:YqaJ-like viral recombinase domain
MTITYHPEVVQGSDEWRDMRCGLLTASEMKLIITPTLKMAANEKERAHLYELLSQRITRYVEPSYISDDMLRGKEEEVDAKLAYAAHYAPVTDVGFVTNDRWGFTIGYSPDGLVGSEGQIECKSRRQKYQIETILEHVAAQTVPPDFLMQVQTGLAVTERAWCDFVSYSGGLHMATLRAYPDDRVKSAILEASAAFEARLAEKLTRYHEILASKARLVPTERRVEVEIYL